MEAYLAQRMAGLKGTDEEVETQMAPYATVCSSRTVLPHSWVPSNAH